MESSESVVRVLHAISGLIELAVAGTGYCVVGDNFIVF